MYRVFAGREMITVTRCRNESESDTSVLQILISTFRDDYEYNYNTGLFVEGKNNVELDRFTIHELDFGTIH